MVISGSGNSRGVAQVGDLLRKRQIDSRTVAWGKETLLVTQRNPPSAETTELRKTGLVERIIVSSSKAQLASRDFENETSIVEVGNARFGCDRIVIIAGPCSVEGREQLLEVANFAKKHGASLLRGGVFKPRTSPYDFQGLGETGLKLLAEARNETGLPVVTEVLEPDKVDLVAKYSDMLQIGARNVQNFALLRTVGNSGMPVLLKRGMMMTIEEWLQAAEYILLEGNQNVVLCERGIRTFEKATRNTLDLAAVPVLRKATHLPIVVDPSHATGIRELIAPMAKAAVAAGTDGLMIETHPTPETALSDSQQQLGLGEFASLMEDLESVAKAVGRSTR
ncbi:MAG TPA: 3-deoxy-7-phosphoheptulonate synthase [Candidatus Acidoferrum sp.]|nr:3-deoxy-7-phosphoheptulonate synthase [Candidatus Acidoferrum sp.]